MKQIHFAMFGFLISTSAFAQSSVPPQLASAAAATGGSTIKLTKEQVQAAMPPLAAHFDEIDTNHLGYVTPAQIQQYVSNHPPQLPPPPSFPQ
ncbi:EF-hand domain-containing protein [Paraburkholderia sp. IMGN_8]|uniref:EF-hand domain-containing protein n=1 Tax=Paraburkholderia sp. IMGN_8 TaxID=3136564 RepID=UPI0031018DCF